MQSLKDEKPQNDLYDNKTKQEEENEYLEEENNGIYPLTQPAPLVRQLGISYVPETTREDRDYNLRLDDILKQQTIMEEQMRQYLTGHEESTQGYRAISDYLEEDDFQEPLTEGQDNSVLGLGLGKYWKEADYYVDGGVAPPMELDISIPHLPDTCQENKDYNLMLDKILKSKRKISQSKIDKY